MGRTEEKIKAAASAIGDSASYIVADVTDRTAVMRAFAAVGGLDHLITCAAGALAGQFAELAEEDVRDFFEGKFWGQHRSVKAALPRLAADGSVVLLSGFLYRKTDPGFSP